MAELIRISVSIFITAFLLHFVWEMWQVPFYAGMTSAGHWQAVIFCSQATLGDGVITLLAFYLAVLASRSDQLLKFNNARIAWIVYLLSGLLLTVGLELLATRYLDRWQYSELMPTLPYLNVGIVPLLQWVVLPPVVLWIARTFVHGLEEKT